MFGLLFINFFSLKYFHFHSCIFHSFIQDLVTQRHNRNDYMIDFIKKFFKKLKLHIFLPNTNPVRQEKRTKKEKITSQITFSMKTQFLLWILFVRYFCVFVFLGMTIPWWNDKINWFFQECCDFKYDIACIDSNEFTIYPNIPDFPAREIELVVLYIAGPTSSHIFQRRSSSNRNSITRSLLFNFQTRLRWVSQTINHCRRCQRASFAKDWLT